MSINELNTDFSLALQKARWRKKITRAHAAQVLNLSATEIEYYESKPIRVPLKDLFRLVKFYELSNDEIWKLQVIELIKPKDQDE